jgi:RecA-family ATPase
MGEEIRPFGVSYFVDRAPKPMEWLIHGILPRRTFGVIGGEPESYKTWFALDAAVALATNSNVLGFGVERLGTSLIYSPEGEGEALRRRLHALCVGRGVDYRIALQNIGVIRERVNISDLDNYQRLAKTIIVTRPDLLILDPLVSIHRANENAAEEMQLILNSIRDLNIAHPNLTCMIVHHTKKVRDGESDGYALRGSSAVYGWEDTLITIRKLRMEDGRVPRSINVSHRDAISPGMRKFLLESSGGGMVLSAQGGGVSAPLRQRSFYGNGRPNGAVEGRKR